MERSKIAWLWIGWLTLFCCVAALGAESDKRPGGKNWPPPRFEERKRERHFLVDKVIVPNRPKV